MNKKRVVITGMGVVAPNGIGIDNFYGDSSFVHRHLDAQNHYLQKFSFYQEVFFRK